MPAATAASVGLFGVPSLMVKIIAARARNTHAGASSRCGTVTATAKHAEVTGHNLKAGALLAFLVLPFAGLNAAFDEDQRTLFEVLLGNFGLLAPHDNLVPLGAFLAFTVFILVGFVRGYREIGYGL